MAKEEWDEIKNSRNYKEHPYGEMKKDIQTLMYYGKVPRECWLIWRYGIKLEQLRRFVREAGDADIYIEKVLDNSHFTIGNPKKWRDEIPPYWPGQVVDLDFFNRISEAGLRDSSAMGEWAIEHGYARASRISLVPYEELKEKVHGLMKKGKVPNGCWLIRNYGLHTPLLVELAEKNGDVAKVLAGNGAFPSFVIETPGKEIKVNKTPYQEETYQFMDIDDFYAGKPHTALFEHYEKIKSEVQEMVAQGRIPCDCWLTQKYGLTLMQNHLKIEAERHGDVVTWKVMEGAGSGIYFTLDKKPPPLMYGQKEGKHPFISSK